MNTKTKNTAVPELRFPEFQGTGEWEEKELGDIGDFVSGGTPDTTVEEYWNGDIQWFTPSEIKEQYLSKSKRTISEKGLKNSSAKLLPKGALLLSTRATVGDVGIAEVPCTTNQGFQSLVVNESESNLFWYYWLIQHKEELLNRASGSTFPEIGKTQIVKIPALHPKKAEQQKIADCLSSLDDLIAARSAKLEALKAHKRGLMQALFPAEGETVPKLRFPEFQSAGAWEEKELKQLARYRRGSFPQPYGSPEWYDEINGTPFIQVFDVDENFRLKPKTKNKISTLATKQSVFIPKGTVIVTLQGSIGRVAITQYDAYIDRTLLLFEKFLMSIDQTFFAYALFLLFEIEKQKAPGGIIKTITKEVLSDFKIGIPPIEEQQKIADCLSSLDHLLAAQAQHLEALKRHKKGLMQSLFPHTVHQQT